MQITLDIPQAELEKLMAATVTEQRISLYDVSWEQYEMILHMRGDRSSPRLSYCQGHLELMTTSSEHETNKKLIARLLELYALEKNLDLYSYGSVTLRNAFERKGLEPDESYCLGSRKDIPDLAIEVIITSGGIDKLAIYQGLGVAEVWFWQEKKFTIYHLRQNDYELIKTSELLPNLDLSFLATFVTPASEPQALREFRRTISGS
ncbi:MAG: Uma2 family endonuclease [Coleofasciculaceae cyanobacterium SM2_1_6]|nr:Uma2 family endonuclease [Coleofasciculaceae cyanobacterium SM2_1_6]